MKVIALLIALLAALETSAATTPLDFDGDGRSDFAVTRFRGTATHFELDWYVALSQSGNMFYAQWGRGVISGAGDLAIPADYDGDGKTDIAVWRPPQAVSGAAGVFYIFRSSDSTAWVIGFGQEADDVQVVGDYDGDGAADLAVYRQPVFGEQAYFIYRGSLNNPANNLTYVPWGKSSQPLKGDFDGDGRRDFCVREATGPDVGTIWLLRSSDLGVERISWGLFSDNVQTGDADGDLKTDFYFRRTVSNEYLWYILERDGGGTGLSPIRWGRADLMDQGIAGLDYDGDGRSDIAVYRRIPSAANNIFIVRRSSDGGVIRYWWGMFDRSDTAIEIF